MRRSIWQHVGGIAFYWIRLPPLVRSRIGVILCLGRLKSWQKQRTWRGVEFMANAMTTVRTWRKPYVNNINQRKKNRVWEELENPFRYGPALQNYPSS